MSLIPFFFGEPTVTWNRHFGHLLNLDDLIVPLVTPSQYCRPWRSLVRSASRPDAGSKIIMDKDKFQISLDVQQFSPDEIAVKTIGQQIVIEGKHEEKQDDHGFISRHFVRKYRLPDEAKPEDVISSLSSEGILKVTAPRKQPAITENERVVPITKIDTKKDIDENTQTAKNENQNMEE